MLKAAFLVCLKMQIITGTLRNPMVFMRFEEGISLANSVRFVAIFGENFDLNAFGFELRTLSGCVFMFSVLLPIKWGF